MKNPKGSRSGKPLNLHLLSDEQRSALKEQVFSRIGERDEHGCRTWLGGRDGKGYGSIYLSALQSQPKAHRVVWELVNKRPIPEGHVVRHSCGRGHEGCVDPDHLILGTQHQNCLDASVQGRLGVAKGSRVGTSVLTEDDVLHIHRLFSTGNYTKRAIAKRFGVSESLVGLIIKGKSWAHLHPSKGGAT